MAKKDSAKKAAAPATITLQDLSKKHADPASTPIGQRSPRLTPINRDGASGICGSR